MIRPMLLISGRMYGGGQRVVFDLLDYCQQAGTVAAELCLLGGPVENMPGVRAEVVKYDGRYNRAQTLWTTARRLTKVVKRLKPDVIHSHGWDAAMIGALAIVGLPIRHLIHIHTMDVRLGSSLVKHRMRRSLTRWMFDRPGTTVVGVSDAVREHWCRALNVPLESLRVIRNGVDTRRFHPEPKSRKSDGIVTLGVASRLDANKGLEELLCALAILAADNLRPMLVIAGAGKLRGELKAQVSKLGLRRQVKFLGFVHEMDKFYRNIDVGVLPSLSEGLPLFVLEAMSSGIPVVATDVGGIREVLRDGIDGYIVPAREPSRLAAALAKVLQDYCSRREMGLNARQRIEAEFSRTCFSHRIFEIYAELLAPTISTYAKETQQSI